MIIKYAKLPKSPNKHFSDLEPGDLFVIGDFYEDKTIYCKVFDKKTQNERVINCLCIQDNALYHMEDIVIVTKLNSYIVVETYDDA